MRIYVMPYGHEITIPDECIYERIPFTNLMAFRFPDETKPSLVINNDHFIYMIPGDGK
jgi:hypothetical protein